MTYDSYLSGGLCHRARVLNTFHVLRTTQFRLGGSSYGIAISYPSLPVSKWGVLHDMVEILNREGQWYRPHRRNAQSAGPQLSKLGGCMASFRSFFHKLVVSLDYSPASRYSGFESSPERRIWPWTIFVLLLKPGCLASTAIIPAVAATAPERQRTPAQDPQQKQKQTEKQKRKPCR